MKTAVVIPVFNEAPSLPLVLRDLPGDLELRVVVADNGSTDGSPDVAAAHGAEVVQEAEKGYGAACLAGLRRVARDPPEVVVFLDGDYSDHPEEISRLLEPLAAGRCDLVIGSRVLGEAERGALLPQARFGNWLATRLIRWIYGFRYTDLGPFRAIRWEALQRLGMADRNFGWTAEMQVKALRVGLRVEEVPVSYRRRVGVSKITGTVQGTVRAGVKILWTVFRQALGPPPGGSRSGDGLTPPRRRRPR